MIHDELYILAEPDSKLILYYAILYRPENSKGDMYIIISAFKVEWWNLQGQRQQHFPTTLGCSSISYSGFWASVPRVRRFIGVSNRNICVSSSAAHRFMLWWFHQQWCERGSNWPQLLDSFVSHLSRTGCHGDNNGNCWSAIYMLTQFIVPPQAKRRVGFLSSDIRY